MSISARTAEHTTRNELFARGTECCWTCKYYRGGVCRSRQGENSPTGEFDWCWNWKRGEPSEWLR